MTTLCSMRAAMIIMFQLSMVINFYSFFVIMISMILVTAAAGLSVGRSLVAATDRPRPEVVKEATRDALIVLAGCLPWILVLGFVEGFLSPSADFTFAFKAAIGGLLEVLFLTLAWRGPSLKGSSPT